jgi:hypothetical protein
MKLVKSTAEYNIYQKRNGVKGAKNKWINGEAKVAILLAEDLVKAPATKAPEPEEEAPAEEAPAADASEES